MPCGQLILQDPNGGFWSLTATNAGSLATQQTSLVSNFSPPILKSPSFNWQLSSSVSGVPLATQTAAAGVPIVALASPNATSFPLSITDAGILTVSVTGTHFFFGPSLRTNITVSTFADRGLTSTVSGATPQVVGADFSIWSCALQTFVPVDSTNMIVVYDE